MVHELKSKLKFSVEDIWENKDYIKEDMQLKKQAHEIISDILKLLDKGQLRVAQKIDNTWETNEWIKKAILLSFLTSDNELYNSDQKIKYFDKVPLKFANWLEEDFNFRAVPGAIVRLSAYVAPNVILMPSFVNVGAYIDSGTLIDTWATVGSCAQIGKNCHISGGVGIGGVLEPLQANPVIIEDNVFIGARSEIAEGVIIEEGAVLSMGVFIGSSTRIYNRSTGEITYGRVPAYSVVVPGTLPSSDNKTHTYAAIIVKKVDNNTRSKTSINKLLREYD
jgi:2,3,4,5-tetrahydropyridine-2-carboxylate N-succinyltransferase